MNYLNTLLFGVYPYLAGAVFLLGSLARFDRDPFTWKAHSSQILSWTLALTPHSRVLQ